VPQAAPTGVGHYVAPAEKLTRLKRVVLVELSAEEGHGPVAEEMTRALFQALQERRLFCVELMGKDHRCYEELPVRGRRGRTLKELVSLRKALGAKAVLLGSVDDFQQYPRMRLGLFLRLIDLQRGQVLWAVDHTWDSTDRQTELRIREFFTSRMRSGYDPLHWRLAMISPRAFETFVAHEAAGTLPKPGPADPEDGTLEKIGKFSEKVSSICSGSR